MTGFSQYFGFRSLGDVDRAFEQNRTDLHIFTGQVSRNIEGFVDSQRNEAVSVLANARLDEMLANLGDPDAELDYVLTIPLVQPGTLSAADVFVAQERLAQLMQEDILTLSILDKIRKTEQPEAGYGEVLLDDASRLIELEQQGREPSESSLRMMQFSLAVHHAVIDISNLSVEDTEEAALSNSGRQNSLSAQALSQTVQAAIQTFALKERIAEIPVYSKG